jgi:hypothetical protein
VASAAEVVWCAVAEPRGVDRLERGGHPIVEFVTAQPEIRWPERDVLTDGRHEELVVGVLEHQPDAPSDLGEVDVDHLEAADLDAAGVRFVDAVQVQRQRGLAGAVGAEQRHALAVLDAQVDTVQCLVPVWVGETHLSYVDRGVGPRSG